jgi:hypothetical protein
MLVCVPNVEYNLNSWVKHVHPHTFKVGLSMEGTAVRAWRQLERGGKEIHAPTVIIRPASSQQDPRLIQPFQFNSEVLGW